MGETPLPSERLLFIVSLQLPEWVVAEIQQVFPNDDVTVYQSKPKEAVPVPAELYQNATILVTFTDLPDIKDAKNLKLIHTLSAGLDHLLSHPILTDTDIPITTSSGVHGPPIAEWTLMNWLIASRQYIRTYEAQKERRWDIKKDVFTTTIHDQVGKKVGILGYGSIGRQIARLSQAVGMTVHAYTASPRPTPESRHDNGFIIPGTGDPDGSIPASWHHGTDKESVRSFLSLGLDHLVVSLPLTKQTTHLLGDEEFALLSGSSKHPISKPYVTNISRGKVIDQGALIAALKSGHLSGAALDVTDPEPLPADNPLWDAPNVQISPHVSGLGKEYLPRSLSIVKINIERIDKGLPLLNAYNRGKDY
ncbi:uncharacterized protein N7443_007647 [Penicillium atrosanguineum]|uniref:D-isomer specific 2-hydroxyacid dehydrogenase NAD-binding n=1 Tax=Penicillium atrosanguineum TaxID=1132637 RepID=A0A9W9PNT4_9EURO|nr:uncharacterized protein N7443_007647 [Penicillium atrosanguineum]KAJ5118715.1 D-isomer specific 2-hydroxyacid dehydrogenase NAD-binding [Penicillium atrosanguineum]KAJ5296754.1 hypothetical protein N7443_007647 [Penicillium atrosanguineum]KAJ5299514.1 D-isomer specific 2-hydroxyacid dehydrogenase NAD-binding [Penicillium atrosanguineum]